MITWMGGKSVPAQPRPQEVAVQEAVMPDTVDTVL